MEKKTDFKAMSGKAKVQYIWDYYKWHILVAILAVSLVIYIIHYYATYRDPLLKVIMINCNDAMTVDETGFDEFLTEYGYDPKESPVSLSASLQFSEGEYSLSYNDTQVLTMMIATGDQDLFFGTGDVYLEYADQGVLLDLSTVLPEEVLERYEDSLVYCTESDGTDAYPCAIELTDNEWVQKYNYYDTCYFGIFYQNQNLDTALEFAEFLLNY